jgi:hypothetical protein
MAREQLIKRMEQIFDKLEIYNKKKKTMGLDDKELERYCRLYIEYLELRLSLWDDIYLSYILPEILYDEAEKLYNELCITLKWDGTLLVKQEDIDKINAEYAKSNKVLVNKKLDKLYKLLKMNLKEYYITLDATGKDIIHDISSLMSNGDSEDLIVIEDFIDYKFEVMYILLGLKGDKNGKTSKSSRKRTE